MKYDDASWHSGEGFPATSPPEYAGTHIALFLKWCFTQGWAGPDHIKEWPEEVEKVISGEISATDFFFKYCDGKLITDDLNEQGNDFAKAYYGKDGLYTNDYTGIFIDEMFCASEAEHDYDQLASIIDGRRQSGILTKTQAATPPPTSRTPWWKFWK